jgi:tetratricopeptide (TPR) repeat protein
MENLLRSHLDFLPDLENEGQIERAIDDLLRVLDEEPENGDIYYKYAQLLQAVKRNDEVVAQLKNAVFFNPLHWQAQNDLGVAYYNTGMLDEALEHLRKAASLEDGVLVHQNLGRLLTELGRYDEAMPEFEKAVQGASSRIQHADASKAHQERAATPSSPSRETGDKKIDADPLQSAREHAGNASGPKFCPVCDSSIKAFQPLPAHYIENMLRNKFKYLGRGEMTSIDQYACSVCGASDRQRLYAIWLEHEASIGRFKNRGRLLHFAPEIPLSKKIKALDIFGENLRVDLSMPEVDCRVDLKGLPFISESFDMFICSHVLEHVEDDDLAISELYRVLRKGGCGILMAPVAIGIAHTIEGTHRESKEERWSLFGQDDHVRLYAHGDFVSKASLHGFHVLELGINYFGEKLFDRLGLLETSVLYIAEKW